MEMSTLKKALSWIMLSSLLLVAACANGGGEGYPPPATGYYYPTYNPPTYYDRSYPEQDPLFWRMWQDRYGGGG